MALSGPFVPRDFLFAIAIGLLLGGACWAGDDSRFAFLRVLANTAGPWILIAFLCGSRSNAALPGAALGAVALLGAILGYYLSIELFDPEQAPNRVSLDAGSNWAIAALPVGVFFGACGAAWSAGFVLPLTLGILGGVLFGEGLLLLSDNPTSDLDYLVVPVAGIAAGFAIPNMLVERRQAAWAILIVAIVGPVAVFVERGLLDHVRGVTG